MGIQPYQFATRSLNRLSRGEDICNILVAAIQGANANEAVRKHVKREGDHLFIGNLNLDLTDFHRIIIIGAGKACIPMADAMEEIIKDRLTSGLVITKQGYLRPLTSIPINKIKIIEASHPIPDQRNIDATLTLITMINELSTDCLVIFLLSGGGSALLTYPLPGLSLQDVQTTTTMLLNSGASIMEINTIRKHLDLVKGGGLAKLLAPATVVTLILSDVMGDRIDMIASGPTAADPTTYKDAWEILKRYNLLVHIPFQIQAHIKAGMDGDLPESVKPGEPVLEKVTNILVGSNKDALITAENAARASGFMTKVVNPLLMGEASLMGKSLCDEAKVLLSGSASMPRPACLIAGGETTVTKTGSGLGGRNQELALGAVENLSKSEDLVLISLATDGGDGPTDAAGAVVTSETYLRGLSLGLDPSDYLKRNDSYHYFEPLGDLIKTGPTFTNVNDLVFIFIL